MRAGEVLARLSSLRPDARDAAIEALFGIAGDDVDPAPPGPDLVGYHASGVAPILRALIEVPVVAEDVLVDLGSGLGKVILLARLLTGATCRGVELSPALVDRARAAAMRLELEVAFDVADAREADLGDGTVFFLYLPFTGAVLAAVIDRLRAVAAERAIVVCALGVDLVGAGGWLVPRPSDAFWLTIYDGRAPGVTPRSPMTSPLSSSTAAIAIAHEQALGERAPRG